MKKLLSILAACILIFPTIITVTPISAATDPATGRNFVFEAQLRDAPGCDTLYDGMVKIDKRDVITIQIATNQPNKKYWARVETGGAGPYGQSLRAVQELGSITTDKKGEGKETFNLASSVPPPFVGPNFVISSSHWNGFPNPTPTIEFDTSFGPVPSPPSPPPAPGEIILNMLTNPSGFPGEFVFFMSYGAVVGYPNGVFMTDGRTIDSGFNLSPGIYTINELMGGYSSAFTTTISINDPTNNSSSSGRFTTVNLAAGEIVTVTYTNNIPPPP